MKNVKSCLKLLFDKLFGAKYIRAGKCKQCGVCCRNITLKANEHFLTTEEQFESLKKWQKKYNHFFISGKDKHGILLFTCKSLGADNRCKSYLVRSWFCRAYPFIKTDFIAAGGQTLEGCGFYFTSSVKFKDCLKELSEK